MTEQNGETVPERFNDLYTYTSERGHTSFERELTATDDATAMQERDYGAVMLYERGVEAYGTLELTETEPAEYVETVTEGGWRCYKFQNGDGETLLIDVNRLREVARNVFDMEYSTFRNSVRFTKECEAVGRISDDTVRCPIFDVPESKWYVVITPIFPSDD